MIENRIGKINPCNPTFKLDHFQTYLGYSLQEKKWFHIIINGSAISLKNSGANGFPTIFKHFHGNPPIFFVKDATQLSKFILKEYKHKKDIPYNFIRLFLKSIKNVLSHTSNVLLSPELVLIDEQNVIFLGIRYKKEIKTTFPTLISWLCFFFTKDTKFLDSSIPWSLVQEHQGKIPDQWKTHEIWQKSLLDQFNFIIKYLKVLQDPLPSENQNFQYSLPESNFFEHYCEIFNDWGIFGSFSILNLSNFNNIPIPLESVIKNIARWKINDLLDGYHKLYYELPDISWFWKILECIASKPLFGKALDLLPIICLSTSKKWTNNSELDEKIQDFLRYLDRHLSFSTPSLTKPYLLNIEFYSQLLENQKHIILPIVLTSPQFRTNLTKTGIDGISFFLNLVIDLRNSPRVSRNYNLWALLNELFLDLNDSEQHTGNWKTIHNLMGDIHNSLKSNPVENALVQSEFFGNLIVSQDWALKREIFSITGEIFDILLRNQAKFLPEKSSPYLDLAKVIIYQQSSTTDIEWKQSLKFWLETYPNHNLKTTVEETFVSFL
jgi:hypothetical protein